MALATATRCCCPPDISAGKRLSRPVNPTSANTCTASSCRRPAGTPCTCITNSTFSWADNTGMRLYAWNTKPMLLRRMSANSDLLSRSSRCPPTVISPLSGVSRPPMALSNVVLPEPDGPDRQANAPSWISRHTWSRPVMISSPCRNVLHSLVQDMALMVLLPLRFCSGRQPGPTAPRARPAPDWPGAPG